MFKIFREILCDRWVLFDIIIFPYLMKVLAYSNFELLWDFFLFENFVQWGPWLIILYWGLWDLWDYAPNGINKQSEDNCHQYDNKTTVSNCDGISWRTDSITNGSTDLWCPIRSIQEPIWPCEILYEINPTQCISKP